MIRGMSDERRIHPRLPLDVEVNFKDRGFARSKDISVGGICVICEDELALDTIINLAFTVPETGEKFHAFAKCQWQRPSEQGNFVEHGFEFWHIEDDAQEILENFLASQAESLQEI